MSVSYACPVPVRIGLMIIQGLLHWADSSHLPMGLSQEPQSEVSYYVSKPKSSMLFLMAWTLKRSVHSICPPTVFAVCLKHGQCILCEQKIFPNSYFNRWVFIIFTQSAYNYNKKSQTLSLWAEQAISMFVALTSYHGNRQTLTMVLCRWEHWALKLSKHFRL